MSPPMFDAERHCISSAERRTIYEATRNEPRADRGTPYPCSQADIDTCLHKGPPNKDARYISANSATNQLSQWLEEYPDTNASAALGRFSKALKLTQWEPDIAIKAFKDLDTAFFHSTLFGNVQLQWKRRARFLITNWCEGYGVTKQDGRHQAQITLNAYSLILNQEHSRSPFQETWRTLLHEMCHAYLFVTIGLFHNLAGDPQTGSWAGGHGTHFRRCIDMVDRRAVRYLGFRVIPGGVDYRDY